MGDVGEIAGAVKSVGDLIGGILSRADRDGPEKELNENITKIQNSFANANLDEQWIIAYRLLNDIGNPITPGGSLGDTERQFRHNALISLAELKYVKTCLNRKIMSDNK